MHSAVHTDLQQWIMHFVLNNPFTGSYRDCDNGYNLMMFSMIGILYHY